MAGNDGVKDEKNEYKKGGLLGKGSGNQGPLVRNDAGEKPQDARAGRQTAVRNKKTLRERPRNQRLQIPTVARNRKNARACGAKVSCPTQFPSSKNQTASQTSRLSRVSER